MPTTAPCPRTAAPSLENGQELAVFSAPAPSLESGQELTTFSGPALESGPQGATFSGGGLLARWWPAVLVVVVVLADQASKWAAGHGAEGVDYTVNSGVSRDLPRLLDRVVAGVPFGGALDLSGAVLLAVLLTVTVRHARGGVRVGLLLYVAGSASNLADRLGLSYATAPAPHPRGVVDLLIIGNANVADQALHAGVAVLALTALLRAVGGVPGVSRALDAAARRARRAWKPALAGMVAAAAGLWVGVSGQSGAVRAARADAATLEQFVGARGVVLPGCRSHGRVSPLTAGRVTYVCPVRLPDGQRRVLQLTTRPSLAAPAVPTVTTTSRRK